MLEKYLLVRKALKKGISKDDLNNKMVVKEMSKAIIDFGDLELICLYAKLLGDHDIRIFELLIRKVYKIANKDNIEWLDLFIDIVENKGDYIPRVFAASIDNLKQKRDSIDAYVINRQSSRGL